MDNLINQCQQLQRQGKTLEDILVFLRTNGCSKVKSIVIITKVMTMTLKQAKEIVHISKTWADVREQDEKFHKSLDNVINQKDV